MQLTTTFRHMDASQAVKRYAEERLEKIKKYFHRDPISAHAVFAVERDHSHMAEFLITLPDGIVIQARETTGDMYSSIDLAGARLERQVRKWKEKIRDHKAQGARGGALRGVETAEEADLEAEPPVSRAGRAKGAKKGGRLRPGAEAREGAHADGRRGAGEAAGRGGRALGRVGSLAPQAPAINVLKEETFRVRTMKVEDAVDEMNMLETDFYVFADVDSRAVSVVYRRKDGHYGLIETGAKLPASGVAA